MARHENLTDEQITRNWNELLQRLPRHRPHRAGVYLAVLSGAMVATALIVAPVAFHRLLFRRRMRPWLVSAANHCAKAGLVALALTISGCIFLVFRIVAGSVPGAIAGCVAVVFFAGLWGGTALWAGTRAEDR